MNFYYIRLYVHQDLLFCIYKIKIYFCFALVCFYNRNQKLLICIISLRAFDRFSPAQYKVSDYEECNLSINIFLHTALLLTTCYERLLRVLSLMLEFTSLRARSFNFILIFTRITNGIICMSLLLIILLPPFLILATNYVDIFKGYMQLFQRKN